MFADRRTVAFHAAFYAGGVEPVLMSNYYVTARSNYFAVKDVDVFKAWTEQLNLSVQEDDECDPQSKTPRRFAIFADNGDENGWPTYNHETDEDVNIVQELTPHLADDEVAILMETGGEGTLRRLKSPPRLFFRSP